MTEYRSVYVCLAHVFRLIPIKGYINITYYVDFTI